MKKLLKFVTISLMVLITFRSIPFYAVAQTADEIPISGGTVNGNLVLDIDHLGDTTNGVTGEGAATFTPHLTNTEISEKGNVVHAGASSNSYKWRAGINTDLELDATSQYVITFKSKLNFASEENVNRFAFFFTGTDYKTAQGVYYQDNAEVYYTAIYDKWSSNAENGDLEERSNMLSGECDYVLTLNNRIVSLYRNEMLVFRTTLTSYKHDAVSVGIMGMHTKASDSSKITIDAGTELATMTNIKIYIGAYTSANGDAEDEDFGGEAPNDENLILALDNLADTSNSVTGDKAASIEKTPNCAYTKVNTDGTVQSTEQQQWYRYGVVTDIPLTMSSQYVVTFKAKHFADDPSGNDVLAFIFTGTDWKNTQAIHYNEVNYFVADYKQWSTNAVNGDKVSQPNRMTEEVEYTLTLNRGMVSLYREGALVFATKMQSFKDDVLSIGLMGYKPTVPDVGTNVSIMTDIKVYNAVYESDKVENGKTITFLNTDGTVLHTKDYIQRWVIEKFPKTTSASDGTVIKWFYKGTNTIVKSPYIVTDNAIIEARELTLALTDVKAAQCTVPADNTQSVRFIASAQTLQATNVGFVIEAKYKENVEGTEIIRTRKWEISSTKVYTSILATENGTVSTVTASELGGVYLTALSVNNVPTNIGQIDFYVTSFITVNDERITSGEPTVFTMVNGTFDNSISLLS